MSAAQIAPAADGLTFDQRGDALVQRHIPLEPGRGRPPLPAAALAACWGAGLSAVLTLLYVAGTVAAGVLYPHREWRGAEQWAAGYESGAAFLPIVPCVLLTLAFVAFTSGTYDLAPPHLKVFGLVGLSLALLYAVVVGLNDFAQLTVVRQSVMADHGEAVALLAMEDPRSAFWAFEYLGYGLMCLATLAISPLYRGWAARLLALNGATGALMLLIPVLDPPLAVAVAAGIGWLLVFPAAMLLAARQLGRATATTSDAGRAHPRALRLAESSTWHAMNASYPASA